MVYDSWVGIIIIILACPATVLRFCGTGRHRRLVLLHVTSRPVVSSFRQRFPSQSSGLRPKGLCSHSFFSVSLVLSPEMSLLSLIHPIASSPFSLKHSPYLSCASFLLFGFRSVDHKRVLRP